MLRSDKGLLTWRLSPGRDQIFGRIKEKGEAALYNTNGELIRSFPGLGALSITDDLWFWGDRRVISLERCNKTPCLVIWDLDRGTHEVVEIPREEVGYIMRIAVGSDGQIALISRAKATVAVLS